MHFQKQTGGKDCGVFSIAFATAIVLGSNPGKITFFAACNESPPCELSQQR